MAALAGGQVAPVCWSGRWRDLGSVSLTLRVVCTGCLKTDMELFWLKNKNRNKCIPMGMLFSK